MYIQTGQPDRQDNVDVEKNKHSPQPITSWMKTSFALKRSFGFMILVSLSLPKDLLISVLFCVPKKYTLLSAQRE